MERWGGRRVGRGVGDKHFTRRYAMKPGLGDSIFDPWAEIHGYRRGSLRDRGIPNYKKGWRWGSPALCATVVFLLFQTVELGGHAVGGRHGDGRAVGRNFVPGAEHVWRGFESRPGLIPSDLKLIGDLARAVVGSGA